MLSIKNLSKKFGQRQVLNDVSITLEQGKIAFLLGKSGVGKSTLLRILNNLETADEGSILLDEKPLLSKDVGMVFQQFNLFENMTVEENITFPLIKAAKLPVPLAQARAQQLLEKYGLKEKATVYSGKLSGGQKQRLAIARSLALTPRIMCLDEPTSALDPHLTNQVARIIQDLAHDGYYVLVASHDISLLERLDCMLYLINDHGKIVENASSKIFLSNPTVYPNIHRFVSGE